MALIRESFTNVNAFVPLRCVRVLRQTAFESILEALDDHDDVSKVFSNFDIDAETLTAVGG